VRFYDYLIKNKTSIINFMYTQCDGQLCNRGTKNLAQVQKALGESLGREVFIYSITLRPEHDTPEVLKAYAEKYGAKPGWTFLTASAAQDRDQVTTALVNSLGLSVPDDNLRSRLGLTNRQVGANAPRIQHSGMIAIINDTFRRRSHAKVMSRPDVILQMIERMKPRPKA
jgi:protein SCO1/2